MMVIQVTPSQAETEAYSEVVGDYLAQQYGDPDMNATKYQLARLPSALNIVSGVKAILPALVYLPNRHDVPPSLAVGRASDLNADYLHTSLKSKVHSTQKTREFRGSTVASAILVEDRDGRHIFLDDDEESAPRYVTEENRELFKKLYDIEHVNAGGEFGTAGLSMVGLLRVIIGSRKKAQIRGVPENTVVDRFLLETFAALARDGKSSDVYAALVRENAGHTKYKR